MKFNIPYSIAKNICDQNKEKIATPAILSDAYLTVFYDYDAKGKCTGYHIDKDIYYGQKVDKKADNDYSAAQKTLAIFGYKLKEIRSMIALNRTKKFNMVGNPEPGFGKYNWCQIVVEKAGKTYTSAWVFRYIFHVPTNYACLDLLCCANDLDNEPVFRSALLLSLCLGGESR